MHVIARNHWNGRILRLRCRSSVLPVRVTTWEPKMVDHNSAAEATKLTTVATSSDSATHWSVVFAAGKDSSPEARAARHPS